jgi:hypothetical protein
VLWRVQAAPAEPYLQKSSVTRQMAVDPENPFVTVPLKQYASERGPHVSTLTSCWGHVVATELGSTRTQGSVRIRSSSESIHLH